jgi:hypothetical protein
VQRWTRPDTGTKHSAEHDKTDAVVNLAFTKFLFLHAADDDEGMRARLRTAGTSIARGFYNDFDADGSRDNQPRETIQFFIGTGSDADTPDKPAPYLVQVTASYRPRLSEVEWDLRRRVGASVEIVALDGALRPPRYTSAEMHAFAYKHAKVRTPGRVSPNVVVWPLRKTDEWWEKTPLERHVYFYPHTDTRTGCPVKGHARSAEAGVETIYRRVYHNPDGYRREGEYDFITYFEYDDRHRGTFDRIATAIRDPIQNPEWQFVVEGPEWRGRRVLRW